MHPRIKQLKEKKLVGIRNKMSFSDNTTLELWRSFIPRLGEIENRIGTDRYSIQVYPPLFFASVDLNTEFEKWAAIEVTDETILPDWMEGFTLHEGTYAVFDYKGSPNDAEETFKYIFGKWLPNSEYILDQRPHFEILGEKYKNDSADSEEEIWIPVLPK